MPRRNLAANDQDDAQSFGVIPGLVAADAAIDLLRCGRSQFFERIRKGIYRVAEVRSTDERPSKQLFRPADLVLDHQRFLECVRRSDHWWRK